MALDIPAAMTHIHPDMIHIDPTMTHIVPSVAPITSLNIPTTMATNMPHMDPAVKNIASTMTHIAPGMAHTIAPDIVLAIVPTMPCTIYFAANIFTEKISVNDIFANNCVSNNNYLILADIAAELPPPPYNTPPTKLA